MCVRVSRECKHALKKSSSKKIYSQRQAHNDAANEQSTTVLHGIENIINFILPRYAIIKSSVDACYDSTGPSIMTKGQAWKESMVLDRRGIKVRYLTDIRKDNLLECKQLLQLRNLEMRHLDGVKGNFGIVDCKEYFAHASNAEGGLPTDAIHSTIEGIVLAQHNLFDNLWKQGIAADARITEIEEGILPNSIEILREPSETIRVAYELVKSAKDEILIIFHTANAMYRNIREGGLNLLVENVTKSKTRVKILVPVEEKIRDTVDELMRLDGVEIRNFEPDMQTRTTILVVDRLYSLAIELRDDTKDTPEEAIGLATYSNSESTVLSYVSIFGTLWKQTELKERLEILNITQKEFINIAAHELRNPIQPILALSDLLQSDTFLNRNDTRIKQMEMIGIIAKNAKRLQLLSEDILDITRIESKRLKLNKQRFSLREVIVEIIETYIAEIKKSCSKVIISFSSPIDHPFTVLADQNRIRQVISNLLDNSLKFTEAGTINVSLETNDKEIIVKVRDTGRGIDQEILGRLFTKFVSKSDKGTGLGLYICKGIIDAHGGQILAENNSDNGATFSFSLPKI